jgi:hypothetical protein
MSDELSIAWEKWPAFWREAEPLLRAHFAEVEGELAIKRPFKVDAAMMRKLNDAGVLKIAGARVDGRLVGYLWFNVMPDIESAGLLMALQGPMYAKSGFAKFFLGSRMLDFCIAELKAMGVGPMFLHHRLRGRGQRLGVLFRRKKAIEIKHEYYLWIGG